MSQFSTEEKYSEELQLRSNKIIHLRKWKVKDRKLFKKVVDERGENLSPNDMARTLIFPCIREKNILLTDEELKVVLYKLREISIGETFEFTFECSNELCQKENTLDIKMKDVNKIKQSDWAPVTIGENVVVFGETIDPAFYYEKMAEQRTPDDKQIADLAMHILSINGEETTGAVKMMEYLENLDVGDLDKIFEEYKKQQFIQDNIFTVKCKYCKKPQKFMFDDIPGFFPETWFIN
jgi:hypothetical protein